MVNATTVMLHCSQNMPPVDFELRSPLSSCRTGLRGRAGAPLSIALCFPNAIFIISFHCIFGHLCIFLHSSYSWLSSLLFGFDPKLFPFHSRDSWDAFTYVINMSLFLEFLPSEPANRVLLLFCYSFLSWGCSYRTMTSSIWELNLIVWINVICSSSYSSRLLGFVNEDFEAKVTRNCYKPILLCGSFIYKRVL